MGTSTTGMTSGVAADIPSVAYIVHGTRYNTTTLSHEMGHCLGLYHTHHGTDCAHHSYPCESGIAELVNGSNATTGGDYIADTPADPRYWNNCNYIGGSSIKDANGQTYSPNPANYMAYSLYTCRNMFTPMQSQRMRDFIANTAILQNVVVPIISGPEAVFTATSCGATYSVSNLPPNLTNAYWTVSGGLSLVADNGTAGCSVTRSSNSSVNYGIITFHYTYGNGETKTVSKQVIARLEPVFYIYKNGYAQNWNGLTAGDEVYFYSHTYPPETISNYTWALKTPQSGNMTQPMITTFSISNEISRPLDSVVIIEPPIGGGITSPCPTGFGTLLFTGRNTSNQKTTLVAGSNHLTLTVTDGCGTTRACQQFTVQNSSYSPYSISPNPTTDVVNFTLQNAAANSSSTMMTFSSNSSSLLDAIGVQLFSVMTGNMVLQQNFSGANQNFSLNLQNIQAGLYIVHIIKNNEIIQISTISVN